MEVAIGFLIALAIGLTGIGGGTLTAPVLVLFGGLPAAAAVGTALVFGTLVKLVAAPLYLARQQVDFRLFGLMLMGGIPGVIAGSFLLSWFDTEGLSHVVLAIVGLTVVFSASLNLLRLRKGIHAPAEDRSRVLPWLTLPIGLEVGFSSAGAGALGTLALLHFTTVVPVQVVGTDLLFGLVVAGVGGGFHIGLGTINTAILWKLIAGGIPGVLIGAQLATRLPARKLRFGLSIWLVYLGSHLLYRGVGAMVKAW
jgi:uncharacterized protein